MITQEMRIFFGLAPIIISHNKKMTFEIVVVIFNLLPMNSQIEIMFSKTGSCSNHCARKNSAFLRIYSDANKRLFNLSVSFCQRQCEEGISSKFRALFSKQLRWIAPCFVAIQNEQSSFSQLWPIKWIVSSLVAQKLLLSTLENKSIWHLNGNWTKTNIAFCWAWF